MINATIWQHQFYPGLFLTPISTDRELALQEAPSSGAHPAAVC